MTLGWAGLGSRRTYELCAAANKPNSPYEDIDRPIHVLYVHLLLLRNVVTNNFIWNSSIIGFFLSLCGKGFVEEGKQTIFSCVSNYLSSITERVNRPPFAICHNAGT